MPPPFPEAATSTDSSPGVGEVATRFFTFGDRSAPFRLAGGGVLDEVTLAYETYGTLDDDGSNAVLVFHALTGSQHAAGLNRRVPGTGLRWTDEMHVGWWDGLIGPGRAIDTDRWFVVCANYLGRLLRVVWADVDRSRHRSSVWLVVPGRRLLRHGRRQSAPHRPSRSRAASTPPPAAPPVD